MGKLADPIRKMISEERYVVGVHASERLEERDILKWQAVVSMNGGQLVAEQPNGLPNPAIEVVGLLPDSTEIKTVCVHLRSTDVAKRVTVHYVD